MAPVLARSAGDSRAAGTTGEVHATVWSLPATPLLPGAVEILNVMVDDVINGRADPSLRIREETRQRVLVAATELRYTPNHAGRALRLSRSGAIALIVPDIDSAVFVDLLKGVEAGADEHELIVLLGRAERVRAGGDVIRRLAGEGRVDGFLLQRQDDLDNEGLYQLQQRKPPVVLVNSGTIPRRPAVSLDDVGAARLATEYTCWSSGIAASASSAARSRRTPRAAVSRATGRRCAMPESRCGPTPSHYARLHPAQRAGRAPGAAGATQAADGALRRQRQRRVRGARRRARARAHPAGRRLGDRHARLWMADSTWPPLTTVKMPLYDLGLEAVRALVSRLGGGSPRRVVVQSPPELIVRASTAPPRPSVRCATSTTGASGGGRTHPTLRYPTG